MYKFWLVWCPTGNNPKFRHQSYEGAVEEAKRLAGLNPSSEFYVLEAQDHFVHTTVQRTQLWDSNYVPF